MSYLPVKNCEVCTKEEKDYIDLRVAKREISDQEAAKELGVSYREYAAHYENHVRRRLVTAVSTDIFPLKELVVEKIHTVSEAVDRLRKMAVILHERYLMNQDEYDSKDILAMGKIERNLAETVKDLAQLQGELTTGDTTNIQINIQKAEKLMEIVMETAPPDYKKFLLQKLEVVQ